jgi:pyridinium-3,5-biscarboxylic acid mononucleotide synthase
MDEIELKNMLELVKNGSITIENAADKIKTLQFEDIGYAKIDYHRKLRNGFPEVIYCEGKAEEHILGIMQNMCEKNVNILATRATKSNFEFIKNKIKNAVYNESARIITIKNNQIKNNLGKIAVVTAGTADIPVSEEAAITAEFFGNEVVRVYDVGVAGIHRLFANLSKINEASVIIVVAGMEGALASVLGGLSDKPIIAVPTSIGYGASFGGLAPLLTMLNSCASGVSVVNIDNGFGAGYMAATINRQIQLNR